MNAEVCYVTVSEGPLSLSIPEECGSSQHCAQRAVDKIEHAPSGRPDHEGSEATL